MASHLSRIRAAGAWAFGEPHLLLALMALFWAINVVLGRYIAGHVPPVALSFVRWSVACLIVLPFAWPHLRRDWPQIRAHFLLMTVLSVTGITAYNTMAYYGLQYTEALNGLVLQSTGPLFVAVWSFILFGERLTPSQTGGITMSLAGVLVIITRGELRVLLAIAFNAGDLWILSGIVLFAFYSALAKRRPKIHQLSFLAFTMGYGALWLIPFYALEIASGYVLKFDALTLATLAYVSTFPSLVAYLFLNRGIELIGPNRAAPFFHLTPVFGSVLAIAFLGEEPHLFHAVGYALVLAGITIASRAPRYRRG
jgi:drug/metabolite transporter (DMT)-like permease